MIRRPPRPTLFPYATLSRSETQRRAHKSIRLRRHFDPREAGTADDKRQHTLPLSRSEEHTSELQSRQYLVCRLLLEKKNYLRERDAELVEAKRRLAP